jgi:sugar phosphate isomerase/epimerase
MSSTRREFLRTAASAGLAASFASQVFGNASPKRGIRLGIASYTFRNFSRSQLIGFLQQLHVTDLNAKNVKDHLPSEEAQESAALAEYASAGIHVHAGGVIPFAKEDDADMHEKFEYARRARLSVIVGGDVPPSALPRLEKFIKAYDLPVGIHNHGPEDKLWPSPMTVLDAVKGMDPRLGCCLDVGHCVRAGTDVVEAIRAAGPRLFNVHMKDLADFHDRESQVAVGEGKIPVRGIFEALLQIKYPGFVDLEYEIHPDNPMPGVEQSFAFMRKLLEEMPGD